MAPPQDPRRGVAPEPYQWPLDPTPLFAPLVVDVALLMFFLALFPTNDFGVATRLKPKAQLHGFLNKTPHHAQNVDI